MSVSVEKVREAWPNGGPAVKTHLIEGFISAMSALVELKAGEEWVDTEMGNEIVRSWAVGRGWRIIDSADGRRESPSGSAYEAVAQDMLAALDEATSGEAEPGGVNARLVSNVVGDMFWNPAILGYPYDSGPGPEMDGH